jgi:hypothetical protein
VDSFLSPYDDGEAIGVVEVEKASPSGKAGDVSKEKGDDLVELVEEPSEDKTEEFVLWSILSRTVIQTGGRR